MWHAQTVGTISWQYLPTSGWEPLHIIQRFCVSSRRTWVYCSLVLWKLLGHKYCIMFIKLKLYTVTVARNTASFTASEMSVVIRWVCFIDFIHCSNAYLWVIFLISLTYDLVLNCTTTVFTVLCCVVSLNKKKYYFSHIYLYSSPTWHIMQRLYIYTCYFVLKNKLFKKVKISPLTLYSHANTIFFKLMSYLL